MYNGSASEPLHPLPPLLTHLYIPPLPAPLLLTQAALASLRWMLPQAMEVWTQQGVTPPAPAMRPSFAVGPGLSTSLGNKRRHTVPAISGLSP